MNNQVEARNALDGPNDFVWSGPGSLPGRYLRSFWQPVYHISDLEPGLAARLRIMGESFTIYRGKSGDFYITEARCPHRKTLLSIGWVEKECIRCFYHGLNIEVALAVTSQSGHALAAQAELFA